MNQENRNKENKYEKFFRLLALEHKKRFYEALRKSSEDLLNILITLIYQLQEENYILYDVDYQADHFSFHFFNFETKKYSTIKVNDTGIELHKDTENNKKYDIYVPFFGKFFFKYFQIIKEVLKNEEVPKMEGMVEDEEKNRTN